MFVSKYIVNEPMVVFISLKFRILRRPASLVAVLAAGVDADKLADVCVNNTVVILETAMLLHFLQYFRIRLVSQVMVYQQYISKERLDYIAHSSQTIGTVIS